MAKESKVPSSSEAQRGGIMPSGVFPSDFDRMFDDFFAMSPLRWLASPEWPMGRWGASGAGAYHRADIVDKESAYEIDVEVPGMIEKDLELSVGDGYLTVSGQSSMEQEEKREGFYLSERRCGAFTRRFRLPDNVDAEKIDATLENGLLKITLPKTAETLHQEKKIAIKARH